MLAVQFKNPVQFSPILYSSIQFSPSKRFSSNETHDVLLLQNSEYLIV